MIFTLGSWRRFVLGLSLETMDSWWKQFSENDAKAGQRLRQISYVFAHGCNTALEVGNSEILVSQLRIIEPDFRGFAFEGAGMGLALIDYLSPWRQDRLQNFLRGAGAEDPFLVHVGAGFAIGILNRGIEQSLASMDPLQRWFAIDGLGFYHGTFYWQRHINKQAVPKRLTGYARRAFDQGLGRGIWFILIADVTRISATISTFPSSRQPDLWSGIGFACTYAGGADTDAMKALRTAAGPYQPNLALGAAMAAECRYRAGNLTAHTDLACSVLCGMSALSAAKLTDAALVGLPTDGEVPSYEIWRQRTQSQITKLAVGV